MNEMKDIEDIIVDIEEVKKAIQVCKNFEKEKGITLIHPKGLKKFNEIYNREEPKRKIEQMINEKISEQIAPINKKMDMLLEMLSSEKKDNQ